jgi:hypothetical protein
MDSYTESSNQSINTIVTSANTITDKETKELLILYNDSLSTLKENVHFLNKDQQSFQEANKIENKMLRDDILFLISKLNQMKGNLSTISCSIEKNINKIENKVQVPNSQLSSKNLISTVAVKQVITNNSKSNSKSVEKSSNPQTLLSTKDKLKDSNNTITNKFISENESNEELYDISESSIGDLFKSKVNLFKSNLSEYEELITNCPKENLLAKFKAISKNLVSLYSIYNINIEKLKFSNKLLEEANSDLSKKIEEFEKKNNKEKFCLHCHKTFLAKGNDDLNCFYHPGKVKYYSCRGCGGDEYFTCCLKCNICSNGCKKAKHVYEV